MSRFRIRTQEEDGVALVTALLAVIILSGLVIVFFNRAMTEMRVSSDARNFETAVHAAEAASENQIRALNSDDDHVTIGNDNGDVGPVDLGDLDDADSERDWVLSQLSRFENVDGVWISTSRGEAFAFRPELDGEPADVLYAAGAIPSFEEGTRNRVRVLKMQIAQDHWVPEYAIMTEGDIEVGGSASVVVDGCDPSTPESAELTCDADIHTNSELGWQGNAADIQGKVTVAGGTCPNNADSAVGGCVDEGVAPKPVPQFSARSFYRPPDENSDDPDAPPEGLNPDPAGDTMNWYDLCAADETVRAPNPDGEPCTGTLVWPEGEDEAKTDFRGWDFNQGEWKGNAVRSGVYYVHGSDAHITGTGQQTRAVTILVDDDGDGSGAGSLEITGNPRFRPAMEDVLFVADRDIFARGTGTSGSSSDPCGTITDPDDPDEVINAQDYAGFIGAGEQIEVRGNMKLNGAILAQDKSHEHSLVTKSKIDGNMCLNYHHDLEVDLTGIWVITFWNELTS
jgi:hypothetical protein